MIQELLEGFQGSQGDVHLSDADALVVETKAAELGVQLTSTKTKTGVLYPVPQLENLYFPKDAQVLPEVPVKKSKKTEE